MMSGINCILKMHQSMLLAKEPIKLSTVGRARECPAVLSFAVSELLRHVVTGMHSFSLILAIRFGSSFWLIVLVSGSEMGKHSRGPVCHTEVSSAAAIAAD